MASIQKHGKKWRVSVYVGGVRRTKVHHTKDEAKFWANQTENELRRGNDQPQIQGCVSDLIERYLREITPKKGGWKHESDRLKALLRHELATVKLSQINASHIAAWRDDRAKEITGSSVNRTLTTIKHMFRLAVEEWVVLTNNPAKTVRALPNNKERDRVVSQDEIERLQFVSGYQDGEAPTTATQRVFLAFLFAIETAMRAGEIVSLTWRNVDTTRRVAHLPKTKNGASRDVPLSSKAIAILNILPQDSIACFNLTEKQREALWRKIYLKSGINDLHFHDTRHTAITNLAQKLSVMELARMVGHRNINQLLTYYNETAENLAKKLD